MTTLKRFGRSLRFLLKFGSGIQKIFTTDTLPRVYVDLPSSENTEWIRGKAVIVTGSNRTLITESLANLAGVSSCSKSQERRVALLYTHSQTPLSMPMLPLTLDRRDMTVQHG